MYLYNSDIYSPDVTLELQMDARLGLVSQSEEPFSRFLTLWQPAVSWRVLWGMWLSNSAGQAVLMHTRILGLSIRAVVEVTKMGHFLGTRGLDLTSSPFGDCCTMTMCNIRLHRGVIILHSWISLLHTFMKSCQTLAQQFWFKTDLCSEFWAALCWMKTEGK